MVERKEGQRIANLSLAQSLEIKLSSNLLSGGEQSQLRSDLGSVSTWLLLNRWLVQLQYGTKVNMVQCTIAMHWYTKLV